MKVTTLSLGLMNCCLKEKNSINAQEINLYIDISIAVDVHVYPVNIKQHNTSVHKIKNTHKMILLYIRIFMLKDDCGGFG